MEELERWREGVDVTRRKQRRGDAEGGEGGGGEGKVLPVWECCQFQFQFPMEVGGVGGRGEATKGTKGDKEGGETANPKLGGLTRGHGETEARRGEGDGWQVGGKWAGGRRAGGKANGGRKWASRRVAEAPRGAGDMHKRTQRGKKGKKTRREEGGRRAMDAAFFLSILPLPC